MAPPSQDRPLPNLRASNAWERNHRLASVASMRSHAIAPYQSNPSGMSLTDRVGMAASQRTHARTEDEQLQERLAQYQINRHERQKRRERTVSPEPANRFDLPEDRLDHEITDAAFSLMVFSRNAETQETSKDMRELIRQVDDDDQARTQRELMYRSGTVDELLPQSASWSVGPASASANANAIRHSGTPLLPRPQAQNDTPVTNTTVVNRVMLPPPRAGPVEQKPSETGPSKKKDSLSPKTTTQEISTKGNERAWKEPATVKDKLERYPSDTPESSSPEDGSKRTRKRSLKAREADMDNAAERASKKTKKSPSP